MLAFMTQPCSPQLSHTLGRINPALCHPWYPHRIAKILCIYQHCNAAFVAIYQNLLVNLLSILAMTIWSLALQTPCASSPPMATSLTMSQ
jgi:hypothetical protein